MVATPWLSLSIWLPIAIGAFLLLLSKPGQAQMVRWIALLGSLVSFLVTLPVYTNFQLGTAQMQLEEKRLWIETFNVFYHLGVDGLSLWFVLLTAFSLFAALRPATTTDAPAPASPRAMPNPMPPLPPVTIATLPVRSKRFIPWSSFLGCRFPSSPNMRAGLFREAGGSIGLLPSRPDPW